MENKTWRYIANDFLVAGGLIGLGFLIGVFVSAIF